MRDLGFCKSELCRKPLTCDYTKNLEDPISGEYKVYACVPLQDFTADSDIDWTKTIPEIDEQLYDKYDLTQEERDFIETNVKPMQ